MDGVPGILDGILDRILDGILNEIASVALLPRNDGILDGILNEIASAFQSLAMTQGILNLFVMRSPDQVGG